MQKAVTCWNLYLRAAAAPALVGRIFLNLLQIDITQQGISGKSVGKRTVASSERKVTGILCFEKLLCTVVT